MSSSWKQLLTECERLTKANGANAWRTAQIVNELIQDREFLIDCGEKLDEAESRLAKFSGRFALGVNDMIQMIRQFPDKKDWVSGRLDILRDETCKAIASKAHRAARDRAESKRVSQQTTVEKEALAVEPCGESDADFADGKPPRSDKDGTHKGPVAWSVYMEARQRIVELEFEVETLSKQTNRLRNENRRLKQQLKEREFAAA